MILVFMLLNMKVVLPSSPIEHPKYQPIFVLLDTLRGFQMIFVNLM